MLGCPFCSIGSELGTQDENIRRKMEQILARQMKYIESLVRDLAAEGLVQSRNNRELAEELISYVTGVLMQAKIENSVQHVERLEHGIRRLLGLRRNGRRRPLKFFCPASIPTSQLNRICFDHTVERNPMICPFKPIKNRPAKTSHRSGVRAAQARRRSRKSRSRGARSWPVRTSFP